MSRYVQPASKAASKIGGLKRGSTAFRIASASCARAAAAIAAASDASSAIAAEARVAGALRGRPGARLADVGEDEPLDEAAPLRDGAHRGADATRSDHKDFHRLNLPAIVCADGGGFGGMRPEDVYELTGASDPRLRPDGERGRLRRLVDRRARRTSIARRSGSRRPTAPRRRASSRRARRTRSRAGRPTAPSSRSSPGAATRTRSASST